MDEIDLIGERFLGWDRGVTVGHTGVLFVFDAREAAEPLDAASLRRHVAERLEALRLLRLRVQPDPERPGRHRWVEDPFPDLDRLIVQHDEVVCDERALGRLAAQINTPPLPRDLPLWAVDVVPMAGDRVALVLRLHHALGDAKPSLEILHALFDIPRGEAPEEAGRRPERRAERAVPEGEEPPPQPVPPKMRFNQPLSRERDFAFGGIRRERIDRVRHAAGATFTEVLLAAWGGALRGWLALRGEVPRVPLVANMPISTRAGARDEGANRLTIALVALPTDRSDGRARLEAAREAMATVRRWPRLSNRIPNLSLSTYRALRAEATWNGAPLLASAAAPVFSGCGLAIAHGTTVDRVSIGVHVDAQQVPDPWALLRAFDAALADLETLSGGSFCEAAARPAAG